MFSAYTSRRCETTSHPFITADGTDLRHIRYKVVANNHLPFNTLIWIDSIGICVVKDRMGSGGKRKFDLYCGMNVQTAKNFGVKRLKYRIIKKGK